MWETPHSTSPPPGGARRGKKKWRRAKPNMAFSVTFLHHICWEKNLREWGNDHIWIRLPWQRGGKCPGIEGDGEHGGVLVISDQIWRKLEHKWAFIHYSQALITLSTSTNPARVLQIHTIAMCSNRSSSKYFKLLLQCESRHLNFFGNTLTELQLNTPRSLATLQYTIRYFYYC